MRNERQFTWDTAGLAALTILAGLLPFELKTPIVSLGPFSITSVELALYLTLLIWAVSRAITRRTRWTPAHRAVVAWAAVIALSALLAPFERDAALKFALRSLGGCALFFAAADWATTPHRAAQVMLAIAAGAVGSAAAALAEVWLPGAAAALLIFKTQTTVIGSFVRAGGTFQYANTATMYWEAALPLALACGVAYALNRTHARTRWIGAAAALVLIEAIILSASRAGLIVAALALVGLIGMARRPQSALHAPAAASLIALAILGLVNFAASPLLALRLRTESDVTWYRAAYRIALASELRVEAGQTITLSVTVRNDGALTWPAAGDYPVFLSYHWYDPASDKVIIFNGLRTALPEDVPPGTEVALAGRVIAPGKPGWYVLQWDMVHEDVIWFSAKGHETGDVSARVTRGTSGKSPPPLPPNDRVAPSLPARGDLWRAGLRMWLERPLLGVGPDNFRHVYGPYLGHTQFDDRIHANSLYVETLANLGLLGMLALIGLVVALARTAHTWRAEPNPQARVLAIGLLVALATFFAHGAVDYFFEFTPTYGVFWLLAGVAAGLSHGKAAV